MLLWTSRSRAFLIGIFGLVVLVVFVAPLATVVLAGLAGSWTGPLPSALASRTSTTRSLARISRACP